MQPVIIVVYAVIWNGVIYFEPKNVCSFETSAFGSQTWALWDILWVQNSQTILKDLTRYDNITNHEI